MLFLRKAMKRASMTLDFQTYCAVIIGEPEQKIISKFGHYATTVIPYNNILNNITIFHKF